MKKIFAIVLSLCLLGTSVPLQANEKINEGITVATDSEFITDDNDVITEQEEVHFDDILEFENETENTDEIELEEVEKLELEEIIEELVHELDEVPEVITEEEPSVIAVSEYTWPAGNVEHIANHSGVSGTWKPLTTEMFQAGGTYESGSLPSGNYYLSDHVILDTVGITIEANATVNLCLNDNVLEDLREVIDEVYDYTITVYGQFNMYDANNGSTKGYSYNRESDVIFSNTLPSDYTTDDEVIIDGSDEIGRVVIGGLLLGNIEVNTDDNNKIINFNGGNIIVAVPEAQWHTAVLLNGGSAAFANMNIMSKLALNMWDSSKISLNNCYILGFGEMIGIDSEVTATNSELIVTQPNYNYSGRIILNNSIFEGKNSWALDLDVVVNNSTANNFGSEFVNSTLTVSGDAQVNSWKIDEEPIKVIGALGNDASINVTQSLNEGESKIVAVGSEGYVLTETDVSAFQSNNSAYSIIFNASNCTGILTDLDYDTVYISKYPDKYDYTIGVEAFDPTGLELSFLSLVDETTNIVAYNETTKGYFTFDHGVGEVFEDWKTKVTLSYDDGIFKGEFSIPIGCTNAYNVTGTIVDRDYTPIEGAKIKLATTQYGTDISCETKYATTDDEGKYELEYVWSDPYIIEITIELDKFTCVYTDMIEFSEPGEQGYIRIPNLQVSMSLDIDEDLSVSGVKGLSDLVENLGADLAEDEVLEVELEITSEVDVHIEEFIQEIKKDDESLSDFMDININKTLKNISENTSINEVVHELEECIEIIINLPYEEMYKEGYAVYREHDGQVDKLFFTENSDGEYISLNEDGTMLSIFTKKFSVYAMATSDYEIIDIGDGNVEIPTQPNNDSDDDSEAGDANTTNPEGENGENDNSESDVIIDSVDTGDNSSIIIYFMLMMLSIVGLIYYNKREEELEN